MMPTLILSINIAAIAVMLVCLLTVFRLRANIPGGVVGKQWSLLTILVTLFTLGYLATPLFTSLPPEVINLLVALIFFFGAVYVWITIRLIYRIIEEMTS
ncbi:MAG: hypothetical protein OEW36_12295 [Hylemonella sp.]|nr:hypothetical protein [Hylemonella sp.]